MIGIKNIKNILFFSLQILLIIYLFSELGIISFIEGLFIALFPILIAFFISICLESIIKKFIINGYNRKRAAIIVYIALLIIIGLLVAIILPKFIQQLEIFVNAIPSLLEDINMLLAKLNINLNSTTIMDSLQLKMDKVIKYFSNSFSVIINIGISFSAAFFISYDYEKITYILKEKVPKVIKEETIYFFSKYIPFFSKYIYSLLLDSLITFVISFLLFTIFKVEYSLIGATIITITNLIPYIGPLLGIIPLVVIGYSVSEYFAIISLVIVLVVQLVESNLIQPLIFKNVIKLHPVEGILGVLVFSYLFGIVGMIFSPLLTIAFRLLFIDKYEKSTSNTLSV